LGLNRGGVGKIGDFQPISRRISETVRDRAKVTITWQCIVVFELRPRTCLRQLFSLLNSMNVLNQIDKCFP